MVRLGVATRADTFERLVDPLRERDVAVEHVQAKERTMRLSGPALPAVDVGFVYPSRLMEGAVVDAHLDVPWVNDRRAVLTSRNKAGVLATLSKAGVPVPETTLVSNPCSERSLRAAAAELGFPLVVKPNSATRGVGVAKLHDGDSLAGVTDYLDAIHDFRPTGDKAFLLQEYLPDARDYRAMVVDGDCVGGVERRLPEEDDGDAAGRGSGWKHNVHRGATATGVDLPAEHRRLAEATAETLEVPYLGVDLLESGGRVLVNETNARPTVDDESKYDTDFYDRLAALIRATAENER